MYKRQVLLNVSIPLFHFGERSNKVRAAKAKLEQTRLQQQNLNEQMLLELTQACLLYTSFIKCRNNLSVFKGIQFTIRKKSKEKRHLLSVHQSIHSLIYCKINTNRKLSSYITTQKYTNRTIYHSYQPFLSSCFGITLYQKTNCTKIIVV